MEDAGLQPLLHSGMRAVCVCVHAASLEVLTRNMKLVFVVHTSMPAMVGPDDFCSPVPGTVLDVSSALFQRIREK